MIEISTRWSEIASKAKRKRHDDRLGNEAASGQRLVDPIADEPALERPALDRRQRHLPRETLADEDPEAVAGAQVPFALPDATAGREARAVLRRDGRALGPGLPAQEPVGAAGPHLVPGGEVVLGERAQHDPPAAQLERRVPDRPGRAHRAKHLLQRGEQRHDVPPACRVAHATDPPDLPRQLAGAGPDLDAVVGQQPAATACVVDPSGTLTVVSWGSR